MNYILRGGKPINYIELPAAAADIKPGMLVEIDTGEAVPHGTALGASDLLFCEARPCDPVSGAVDADGHQRPVWADVPLIAAGETLMIIQGPGMEVYAWLAAGEAVVQGGRLESDGAGALQAVTTGVTVGYAKETVDNGAGGSPVAVLVTVSSV